MPSVAEKSPNTTDSYGPAEPAGVKTHPHPAIASARGGNGRRAKGRRRWEIGGGCALAVLLLFGLFHSRSLPKERTLPNPMTGNDPARRDANPTAATMAIQPPPPSGYAETDQRSNVHLSAGAAKASNALVSASGAGQQEGPMIVRTVSLNIQVKDVGASRAALDAVLARYQGYAADLNINTPENAARSFSASLRIPTPALNAALADLRRLGNVQNETQAGEEVTQQHADLVARLKNARETEQRLLAILQQRTGKVEEVLQVEEEISTTRGEIERMEAGQKALEHRVDFATIQLKLAEEFTAQFNAPEASVGTRTHNALVNGLGNAGNSLLGILLFLEEFGPVLLVWFIVLGAPAWLLWRRYRNVQART